jgi:general stress protein 26
MHEKNDKAKLVDTLRAFDTLMVATNAPNGTIHARPMTVAEVADGCEVWFVTHRESHKIDEIAADATALVTGQDGRNFVSLSGELDVVDDPARVATLWKASWTLWFPNGKEDPALRLLRLRPAIGEYWLGGGIQGVRYLFEATRALLLHTTPREELLAHAKVPL